MDFDRDYVDNPRYKGHPDNISAFAAPQRLHPKKVSDEFYKSSVYKKVMYNNTMADYYAGFEMEKKKAFHQQRDWTPACVVDHGRAIEASMAVDDDNLNFNSILVSDKHGNFATYIIVKCKKVDDFKSGDLVEFVARGCPDSMQFGNPNHPETNERVNNATVRIMGYVGSYMQQGIAWQFAKSTPLMRSVMAPSLTSGGDYCTNAIDPREVPINSAQRKAVDALKYDVELVQGPPGTGKSTTIYHIINSRIAPDKTVLVTCSRNGAVDSIAGKLKRLQVEDESYMLVEGHDDRVGPTAVQYKLENQVKRHSAVREINAKLDMTMKVQANIEAHLKRFKVENMFAYTYCNWHITLEAAVLKEKWDALTSKWNTHIESLYRDRFHLLQQLKNKVEQLKKELILTTVQVRKKIVKKTRVFLSTISVSDRLPCSDIHTCIVDEAGCMGEQELGILLGLKSTNLILIGDHKQLSPFTNIQPDIASATKCNRSFFERAVDAAGEARTHFLDEQYRMPVAICDIVSRLFYAGRLRTAKVTAASGLAFEHHHGIASRVTFMAVDGQEAVWRNQKSSFNKEEVKAVGQIMPSVLRHLQIIPASAHDTVKPAARIAVMTPYKAQKKLLHEELAVFAPDVEVITIDSAQGLEYDLVVLSMVKTSHTPFLADAKRANVAISRAKYGLFIVGHERTLSRTKYWKKVMHSARHVNGGNLSLAVAARTRRLVAASV
jgi:hypothetical protein